MKSGKYVDLFSYGKYQELNLGITNAHQLTPSRLKRDKLLQTRGRSLFLSEKILEFRRICTIPPTGQSSPWCRQCYSKPNEEYPP